MIAVNDIGLKIKNKIIKKMEVVKRGDRNYVFDQKECCISHLINPKLELVKKGGKDIVICFCDGINIVTIQIKQEKIDVDAAIEKFEKEVGDISNAIVDCDEEQNNHHVIMPTFQDNMHGKREIITANGVEQKPALSYLKNQEHQEVLYKMYSDEKKQWILKHCSDDYRLVKAIELGYDCETAYIQERLNSDFPEFEVINHHVFFNACELPSEDALRLEQQYINYIKKNFVKYEMHTRIGLLVEKGSKHFNGIECLILFNYLTRCDIFAPIHSLCLEEEADVIEFEYRR